MAKQPKPPERVALVWPRTGATANPFSKDADEWIKQGWKLVDNAKEANDGDQE